MYTKFNNGKFYLMKYEVIMIINLYKSKNNYNKKVSTYIYEYF